jgi:hypothetical protein
MRPKITAYFNLIFLLYLFFLMVVNYLFSPESLPVPWDRLFERSPVIAIVGAISILIIIIGSGSYIIRAIWNRFLSDIFGVRLINIHEAMMIFLLITFISL